MIILPMVLSAALGAQAPSIAVVGPDTGPGSRARANVEAALEDREDVLVVRLREWKAAAARIGLRGRAAVSPDAVRRVSAEAGVAAALLLAPRIEKGERRLAGVLVDASGRELWSGSYAISGKDALTPPRAAALAEKIAALVRPPPPPPPPPVPVATPPPPPVAVQPPPPPPAPREPVLRIALGVPVTWRSASVTPRTGTGFTYHGGSPYPGVELDVALAPLRAAGATGWVAALEIEASASQRFASAVVVGGGPTLDAREQRLGVDAVYPVRLGAGTRVAPRVGYGWHRFTIDANAVMPESLRHGLRLGLDGAQRVTSWLGVEASVRAFPAMGPGAAERAAFGADASGWGYELGGALSGPIYDGLGWRAAYDFLRFSDSYSGTGANASDGTGLATYHTATAAVTFSW